MGKHGGSVALERHERAPVGLFQVAKAMMTEAALAIVAGDPRRVEKAELALATLRQATGAP